MALFTEQPRHFPGLHYLFGFLTLMVCGGLIIISLLNILLKKNKPYNVGAIIIHCSYGFSMIAYYLILYYSQFE